MSDRKAMAVVSRTPTNYGYIIHSEYWPPFDFEVSAMSEPDEVTDELVAALEAMPNKPTLMETCYTESGAWIGDEKTAKLLCEEMGISPEMKEETSPFILRPCSIGFCEREQKWYGWSHRAIYGFGVGSHVKAEDCAYRPRDEADFRRKYLEFFGVDEYHENEKVEDSVNADGQRGALITATYTNDVPNERLRGTEYRCFWPYENEDFGRGEWVAETLEDAKQMAIDFADGVS